MELATLEKALLAFDPIKRIVPTTRTRITASITAYSAISCPVSSDQILRINSDMLSSMIGVYSFLEERTFLDESHHARWHGCLSNAVFVDFHRKQPATKVFQRRRKARQMWHFRTVQIVAPSPGRSAAHIATR